MVHFIDDDAGVRASLDLLTRTVGIEAQIFASARSFLEKLPDGRPDWLVTDLRMPNMDGEQLRELLVSTGHKFPIAIMTGSPESDQVERLRNIGVPVLAKPIRTEMLLGLLKAKV